MDGKHVRTHEWQLDEFEANVPVSSELFTLSALELPGGARILDRRRPKGLPLVNDAGQPIPYRPKIYRLPYDYGEIDEKKLGRLIEQIEALPPR